MAQNLFTHAKSIYELEDLMEVLCSPENLYRDGESSPAEARATEERFRKDYEARLKELLSQR